MSETNRRGFVKKLAMGTAAVTGAGGIIAGIVAANKHLEAVAEKEDAKKKEADEKNFQQETRKYLSMIAFYIIDNTHLVDENSVPLADSTNSNGSPENYAFARHLAAAVQGNPMGLAYDKNASPDFMPPALVTECNEIIKTCKHMGDREAAVNKLTDFIYDKLTKFTEKRAQKMHKKPEHMDYAVDAAGLQYLIYFDQAEKELRHSGKPGDATRVFTYEELEPRVKAIMFPDSKPERSQ